MQRSVYHFSGTDPVAILSRNPPQDSGSRLYHFTFPLEYHSNLKFVMNYLQIEKCIIKSQ